MLWIVLEIEFRMAEQVMGRSAFNDRLLRVWLAFRCWRIDFLAWRWARFWLDLILATARARLARRTVRGGKSWFHKKAFVNIRWDRCSTAKRAITKCANNYVLKQLTVRWDFYKLRPVPLIDGPVTLSQQPLNILNPSNGLTPSGQTIAQPDVHLHFSLVPCRIYYRALHPHHSALAINHC